MHAVVGDRLHVRGNAVGHPDRMGEIVEVREASGEPPYLVRFDDGHTCLVFPGPDAVVEHPRGKARPAPKMAGSKAAGSKAAGPKPAGPKTGPRKGTAKA